MRFRCLVVDHDDTVVNSTATVHYPCFAEYMALHFPHVRMTLEEYFLKNFDPGVVTLFRDIVGMTDEDMAREEIYWREYVRRHVPEAYPGMRELLWRQKDEGGFLCVSSHSLKENILRDYRENGLPEPDLVFGWDCPPGKRKPDPYALTEIMKTLGLAPGEMLMLDDLKPGYDMARAAGVPFAAAGWSNDIAPIEAFMRRNCDLYFKDITSLYEYLFGTDGGQ